MLVLSGFSLIKLTIVVGIALWNLLEGIGLLKDFTGAQKIVGRIMNMELVEAPPAVLTTLINRRVSHPFWHKAGAWALIVLNFAIALLLLAAILSFALGGYTTIDNEVFLLLANYGLALFISMGFTLSLVGLWFAYYVKQIDLMITHFVLIILGMVAAGVININVVY